MNEITQIVGILTLIGKTITFMGILITIFSKIRKIQEGTKCQLRSEMLRIYYRNREQRQIRQYEYENFVMLYEAYKTLKGNSFLDKIYTEIKEWEVIT